MELRHRLPLRALIVARGRAALATRDVLSLAVVMCFSHCRRARTGGVLLFCDLAVWRRAALGAHLPTGVHPHGSNLCG